MVSWKRPFTCLALVLIVVSTGVARGNILINGDFEQGAAAPDFLRLDAGDDRLTQWTILPVQIDVIGGRIAAANGTRSIDLDGDVGNNGHILQAFPTIPGVTYDVSFSMAGNVEGDPAIKTMQVMAAGQSTEFAFDITGNTATDPGWVTETWSFVANAAETKLEFISTTIPAGYGPMIDDVVVTVAADGVEIFDLPPGEITELVQGEIDPRFPRVRVGVPEDLPPAFYFRINSNSGTSGKRVEAGECFNTYWDSRPLAAAGFPCPIPAAIDVWQISTTLYFPEACDITLVPKFLDSTLPRPDCAVPDAELCVGPPATFSIPTPGTYTLSMGIDCDCFDMDNVFFITVCVVDKTCSVGPFMTTAASGGHECFSYIDLGTGAGWEDVWIKYPSLPGPFQVSGNAACCVIPVDVEPQSWGEMKSRFGDDEPE